MNRDIFKPPSSLICHSKYGAKFKVFSHGLAALLALSLLNNGPSIQAGS
jgi:hypothetical protein